MLVNRSYDAAVPVTPRSDAKADINGPFAGLLVAQAGTVVFIDEAGNTVTLGSCNAGTVIPVKAINVQSSSQATIYGLKAVG